MEGIAADVAVDYGDGTGASAWGLISPGGDGGGDDGADDGAGTAADAAATAAASSSGDGSRVRGAAAASGSTPTPTTATNHGTSSGGSTDSTTTTTSINPDSNTSSTGSADAGGVDLSLVMGPGPEDTTHGPMLRMYRRLARRGLPAPAVHQAYPEASRLAAAAAPEADWTAGDVLNTVWAVAQLAGDGGRGLPGSWRAAWLGPETGVAAALQLLGAGWQGWTGVDPTYARSQILLTPAQKLALVSGEARLLAAAAGMRTPP